MLVRKFQYNVVVINRYAKSYLFTCLICLTRITFQHFKPIQMGKAIKGVGNMPQTPDRYLHGHLHFVYLKYCFLKIIVYNVRHWIIYCIEKIAILF